MAHLRDLRWLGGVALLSGCSLIGGFGEDRVAEDGTSSDGSTSSTSDGSTSTASTSPSSSGSGPGGGSSSGAVTGGGEGGGVGPGGTGAAGGGGEGAAGGGGTGGAGGEGTTSTGLGGGGSSGSGGEGPVDVWPDSPTMFCSDGTSGVVPCPAEGASYFGQDGNVMAPLASYDVMSTVVRDPTTGLTWQRTALAGGLDWVGAAQACDDLVLDVSDDWRLPSMRELASLWDAGSSGWRIDTAAFPDPDPSAWSSTPVNPAGGEHVVVRFDDTVIVADQPSGEPGVPATRCVRGAPHVPLLVAVDADVAVDQSTELMWEINPSNTDRAWAGALAYCQNLAKGGFDDWRLPTIKELVTIIDPARRPAVLAFFSGYPADYRWTSTPSPSDPSQSFLFILGVYNDATQQVGYSNANATTSAFFRAAACVRDAR